MTGQAAPVKMLLDDPTPHSGQASTADDAEPLPERRSHMPPYKESFPAGSKVRIAGKVQLEEFKRTWMYHHKLQEEQLAHADEIAEVERVSYYHGGDVLYELCGLPGVWHEVCVTAADAVT